MKNNLLEMMSSKTNCSMFDIEQMLTSWINDNSANHSAWFTKLKLQYGEELLNQREREVSQLKWDAVEYLSTKHLLDIISQREKELSIMMEYLQDHRLPPIEDVTYEMLTLNTLRFNWFKMRFQVSTEALSRVRQRLLVLERKLTKQATSIFLTQRFLQLAIINETEEYAYLRTLTDRGFW